MNLSDTTGEASIMGRRLDFNNLYELALGSGANKWTLRKRIGGVATTLGTGSFTFSAGSWVKLKLSMNGTSLVASASTDGTNFTTLTTVTDSGRSSGKIGVRAGNVAAAFDDVLVVSGLGALTAPAPGDFNRDGIVNLADLMILAQHYGRTSGGTLDTGDANGDGAVDFADLLIVAQHFGTGSAVVPIQTPEGRSGDARVVTRRPCQHSAAVSRDVLA